MRIEQPLSQKELKDGDIIPKGDYDFFVEHASDEVSKAGADMIKLKIRIFLPNGKERIVFDYLLEAMKFKLGHFAESTGLIDKYNQGAFYSEDCIGKSGRLKLGIKVDKDGVYADQNNVVDYIPNDVAAAKKLEQKVAAAKEQSKNDFPDDDLPF